MAEVMVRVCDVDLQQGKSVRHYSVTVDGVTKELDLCDRHAGPFAPEAGAVTSPVSIRGRGTAKKAASPGPGRRRKVTTLEEIEAMKQQ